MPPHRNGYEQHMDQDGGCEQPEENGPLWDLLVADTTDGVTVDHQSVLLLSAT